MLRLRKSVGTRTAKSIWQLLRFGNGGIFEVSFSYNFNKKLIHGKAELYCRDKGMKLYNN